MNKLITMSLLGACAVAAVPIAVGAAGSSDGQTYTGCLHNDTGKIKRLAQGDTPLQPCGASETEVTLGTGDVTAVLAGTGLVGGATDGDATLSLSPDYQLPQGCSTGQVAEWDSGGTWNCATPLDTDTDELGKYGFSVGIGQLTVAGPTVCADHGTFTSSNDQIVNQPPITIPAGRYLVVPEDVRWDIEQYKDVDEVDTYPYGFVDMTLFDDDDDQVATRWRRAVNLNVWGSDNFEPGTFVSDGGEYYMRYLVNAGACTESQLEGGFTFVRVG